MKTTGPRVHILFEFQDGPWGGGNQFLRALQNQWKASGVHVAKPGEADVILVNSHHQFSELLKLKQRYPNKIIVHRIDGPISEIRQSQVAVDHLIYEINRVVADGTIFQSEWSRQHNRDLGLLKNAHEITILNAPDPSVFYPKQNQKTPEGKMRLLANSWSPNERKGFGVYRFLDQNLDFSKYAMTFVGNSPVQFKNIQLLEPLPSEKLADQLREHDIFITASQSDPCSNSLIEALHCGLPAVILNDGGHPEIVGQAGKSFKNTDDVLAAIDDVAENLPSYRQKIDLPAVSDIAETYYTFMTKIASQVQDKSYTPKRVRFIDRLTCQLRALLVRVESKIPNR